MDYDGDGALDLFVAHYLNWQPSAEVECFSLAGVPDYCSPASYDLPSASTLYHNNGNGTFTDVSERVGHRAAVGNGLGVVAGDFDGDGRIDIFVANDRTPNHLWLNQGGGRFRESALTMGCALDQDGIAKSGMGVDAVDRRRRRRSRSAGRESRRRVGLVLPEPGTVLHRRHRVGRTADAQPPVHAVRMAAFRDFDNDGYLDLYEANGRVGLAVGALLRRIRTPSQACCFGASPGPRFEEVTPRGGTRTLLVATSRAAAFGDIDNDGGIDIVVVNRDSRPFLLHNVVQVRGHWMMFRVLDEHGRDALGAEVTMTVGLADDSPRRASGVQLSGEQRPARARRTRMRRAPRAT